MITVDDYFMGRREQYPLALTPAIERNAVRTVNLVNALMARALIDGVHMTINPVTRTPLTSGWRPPAVNAVTPNAAVNSRHMTAEACDVYDPEERIDTWLMSPAGQAALKDLGLWMEHPSATVSWAHVQIVPPHSGNRVFYP